MMEWVAVFVGGGLGSLARLATSKLLASGTTEFPWGTLVANVVACLILGFAAGFIAQKGAMHPTLKMGLTAGFCGGFSTFSTFSLESVAMWESGRIALMVAYIAVSVSLCFLGVALGQWLGKAI